VSVKGFTLPFLIGDGEIGQIRSRHEVSEMCEKVSFKDLKGRNILGEVGVGGKIMSNIEEMASENGN